MATQRSQEAGLIVAHREGATYVHVSVEGFGDSRARASLDEVLALLARLQSVLTSMAPGWSRPAGDEASVSFPETCEPWRSGRSASAPTTPLDWAETLSRRVMSEVGFSSSVGIAKSAVAARTCSRLARPRGALLLLPGYEKGLLSPLPVEELDAFGPRYVERLHEHGLRTVSDLAALDAESAVRILGASGAVGVKRVTSAFHERSSASSEPRVGLLERLAEQLAQGLKARGLLARGLELRLEYRDGTSREKFSALPEPTRTASELTTQGRRLYSRVGSVKVEPVVRISLAATGLFAPSGQLDLFGRSLPREIRRSSNVGSSSSPKERSERALSRQRAAI